MIQEFLNKDVELVVAFSAQGVSGGSIPERIKGRILNVDETFCKIQLVKSNKVSLIALKFIIAIKEL